MRLSRKSVAALLVAFAALAASAGETSPQASGTRRPPRRWAPETVDLFAKLPVQDGGRVKPLSTFAGFTLLGLNGMRSAKTRDGERLDPTQWVLDCLFFPEEAMGHACFVVQDSEALDAIGVAHEGRNRRDRYSYAELEPARPRLFELAAQYERIEPGRRSLVQGQIVDLAHNLMQFERVAGTLAVLRRPPAGSESPAIAKSFGVGARPTFGEAVARAGELRPFLSAPDDPHGGTGAGPDPALAQWAADVVAGSGTIALVPPSPDGHGSEWLSPAVLAEEVLFHGHADPGQAEALLSLEALFAAREDATAFHAEAERFRDRVVSAAQARGEYRKVPLEVAFYRLNPFAWSQGIYVIAFLLVACTWIRPWRIVKLAATSGVVAATLLLATGITLRCLIRERPPVSTLYESVLFVTGVGVVGALVAEWIHRRGISLAIAAVLGSAGMFLAGKYEVQEGVDTMPSLVAVLDTNFWLWTHVTAITIGYGAGLLAGAIGHVFVLGRALGLKKGDPGFYRTLSTTTYGVLCFGLLFSVLGTVLGGIWANESWGRFWGWDPKENGALTIVLWQLLVLHGRIGGLLRDFGVAMASVFGAAVVAASWWGVNLLGVGLHSYGFTSGILWTLLGYFAFEGAVLLAGGVHWTLRRHAAPASETVLVAGVQQEGAGAVGTVVGGVR